MYRKSSFQGCSWLVSGNRIWAGFPPFPVKNGSLCLNCVWRPCNLCWHMLSFWQSEILVHARQKVPAPNYKSWALSPLMNFPGRQHFKCVVTTHVAAGIKCTLCDKNGRGLLEAYSWFTQDFAPFAFPFADFASYPFPVTSHSHEYDYVLSSVGLLCKTPTKPRGDLGNSRHTKVFTLRILSIRWTIYFYLSNTFFPWRQAKVMLQ